MNHLAYALIVTVACLGIVGVEPVQATDYEIDVKITNAKAYESIDLVVDYASAPGSFNGSGADADCSTTVNALFAYNNCDSTSLPGCANADELKSATAAATAMQGPIVLYTCIFDGASAPVVGDFSITVGDWSASHATAPTVAISRIEAQ